MLVCIESTLYKKDKKSKEVFSHIDNLDFPLSYWENLK